MSTACRKGHALTPDNVYIRKSGKPRCKRCVKTTVSKNYRKRQAKKHAAPIHCVLCQVKIERDGKRLSVLRTEPYQGKYACEACQQKRLRKSKTEWMKNALKDPSRADKYRSIRNRAGEAWSRRNPEVAKARAFINSVRKRMRTYDMNAFRSPGSKAMAAFLSVLPEHCVDCGTRYDLTIDHIFPLARGGDPVAFENMTTRCRSCNTRKGIRV